MKNVESDRRIELGGAHMAESVFDAVADVLRSGWPGPGKIAEEFEAGFASYCGGRYPVAVNSCTAALHLAVRLLNLKPGTEVVTTPVTFVATNQVLLYEELVPVFADIESTTGNLSVQSIAERITDRTGAVMIMHYGGYPCDLDEIYALADQHGLPVIEDCAHAAGASYHGRHIGSHGTLQAFSFQSIKNLSAVDGGLLFVRNEEEVQRARRLRWMGIDSSTYDRTEGDHSGYSVGELGYRYAMSDLNAAIALAQLECLDDGNTRRAEIVGRYEQAFADIPALQLLQRIPDRESSHHLFTLLCESRDGLAAALRSQGIVTGNHYQRNDAYPLFQKTDLPSVEYFCNRVLNLPLHSGLSDSDVKRVIDELRRYYQ